MTETFNESKNYVPGWASTPLGTFVDDQIEAGQLLQLAMSGISVLRAMPQGLAALAKYDPDKFGGTEGEGHRDGVRRNAELADREVSRDFPMLHAQAVVSLWSSLEVLIRDLLALWLQNRPETLQRDSFKRLRVRVAEYEALTTEERSAYLVEMLEQELQASLKPGAGRFECLLDAIGLGGGLPDGVRKRLLELSQIRNVLVHRRGVVDKRFTERCPWINVSVGKTLVVSDASLTNYHIAAMAYSMIIVQRLSSNFGAEPDENLAGMIMDWNERVSVGIADKPNHGEGE